MFQIVFFVGPLVFHQFFSDQKSLSGQVGKDAVLFYLGTVISILLCISFPVVLENNQMFDLRQIPFILGALYGGRRVAGLLFLVIFLYRFAISGFLFPKEILVELILLLTLLWVHELFEKGTFQRKQYICFWLSVYGVLLKIGVSYLFVDSLTESFWELSLSLFFSQTIGLWISLQIISLSYRNQLIREEIQRAEQLRVVSELAASISHEVRNPLTVTRGFLQLLGSERSEEKKEVYRRLALEELDRAQGIISDYLTFAKPPVDTEEKLNVREQLEYVLGVMNPYALMNKVEIKTYFASNGEVRGDKMKFRQCFINLLKNGIEAMPNGGTLTLRMSVDRRNVFIHVEDTGVGMTLDQIKRLGTPYFSNKETGTGLGIMVVYSVIRSMGGDIFVHSVVGEGSIFTVMLPLAEPAVE